MVLSYLGLLLCSIKTVIFNLKSGVGFSSFEIPCLHTNLLVNFNSPLQTSGNGIVGIRAFPFSSFLIEILVTVIALF